mmetsp:Transcript_30695/g.46453  ORF Transcript_30695/g.46453 Transcript_30695/m.46453 type:complete len:103 (-) Transcript_30695:32-340(-)
MEMIDSPQREFSYTAQRIGFPIFGELHDETEDFRRESLAESTRASREIFSLVRLNMNEAGLNTFLSKLSRLDYFFFLDRTIFCDNLHDDCICMHHIYCLKLQ